MQTKLSIKPEQNSVPGTKMKKGTWYRMIPEVKMIASLDR